MHDITDGSRPVNDESVKSHKILLEKLFKRGLQKSENVIEALSEYFNHIFFEQYPNQSGAEIANSLVTALVECLRSSDYKVVCVASIVLRKYINKFGIIPPNCVSTLIEALNSSEVNSATSASQLAFTLGCIGCSKPDTELVKELGIIPIHDIDRTLCHKCSGGFMRIENAKYVVPSLVDHLNRPISRDRSRLIRRACAIALGQIGFTNPTSVSNALPQLRKFIKEEKGMDGIIFALGCIGYTRPDLVDEYIQGFEKISRHYYGTISLASRSALKKIGMETNSLLKTTLAGKSDLETTTNILFERMKKYNGRLVAESIFAIKDLAKKFPDQIVAILNEKLKDSTGCLEQNICMTFELLSKDIPSKLKQTIPLLIEHFTNRCYTYVSINSSANALSRIFRNNPEFVPKDLEDILVTFLRYEKRPSVANHVQLLLDQIRKSIS